MSESIASLQDDVAILRAVEAQLGQENQILKKRNAALESELASQKAGLRNVKGILDDNPDVFYTEPDSSVATRLERSVVDIRDLVYAIQAHQGEHRVNPTSAPADKDAFIQRMVKRRVQARDELKSLRDERAALKGALEAERQKPAPASSVELVADVRGNLYLTVGGIEFVFAPGTKMVSMRSKS